ncbi:MAG: T9SS type A sorting domain-containing protein [Bacteroidetes bacterium]|nr:T9SS type A sorting domain-containing protein [Bacteroidota bacterium]
MFFCFGITEYYYKNAATNTLQYLGYYSTANEVHISNAQNVLVAPFAYGNSSSNAAVTGTGFSGSTISGTVSVVADAHGTITVGGITTTNVLRVRTEYAIVEDFGGGLSETISFVKYAWYKQGLRAPYMQIMNYDATGDIATISQKFTLVANVTVGVDELSKPTLSFSVFPNPVGDTAEIDITIDQNADMAIRLMDIAGKVVMTEKTYYTKGTHHLSMDVSNLPKGIYILSIKGGATVREEQIVIAE